MGQYYRTVIKNTVTNEVKVFDGGDFNNFVPLKLLEHSWIGNKWVDFIANCIYKQRCKVAHIGDYANSEEDGEFEDDIYSMRNDKKYEKKYNEPEDKFDYKNKYLVNHTSKEYIDLNKYMGENLDHDEWIMNPITLLTAVGNGKGGGDYPENYPDSDYIGLWTWSEIELTDSIPTDYVEVMYDFIDS